MFSLKCKIEKFDKNFANRLNDFNLMIKKLNILSTKISLLFVIKKNSF